MTAAPFLILVQIDPGISIYRVVQYLPDNWVPVIVLPTVLKEGVRGQGRHN